MLFSNKPSLVVWLKRNSMVCADNQGQLTLDVPENLTHNLEVSDRSGLVSSVEQFCKAQKIENQHVVIVLDEPIVFQKTESLSEGEDPGPKIESFTSKIPLNADACQTLTVPIKGQLILLGTNKQYYQAVLEGIEKGGSKVVAIIPIAAYGLRNIKTLDSTLISNILTSSGPIKGANFLNNH